MLEDAVGFADKQQHCCATPKSSSTLIHFLLASTNLQRSGLLDWAKSHFMVFIIIIVSKVALNGTTQTIWTTESNSLLRVNSQGP